MVPLAKKDTEDLSSNPTVDMSCDGCWSLQPCLFSLIATSSNPRAGAAKKKNQPLRLVSRYCRGKSHHAPSRSTRQSTEGRSESIRSRPICSSAARTGSETRGDRGRRDERAGRTWAEKTNRSGPLGAWSTRNGLKGDRFWWAREQKA